MSAQALGWLYLPSDFPAEEHQPTVHNKLCPDAPMAQAKKPRFQPIWDCHRWMRGMIRCYLQSKNQRKWVHIFKHLQFTGSRAEHAQVCPGRRCVDGETNPRISGFKETQGREVTSKQPHKHGQKWWVQLPCVLNWDSLLMRVFKIYRKFSILKQRKKILQTK